MIDHRLLNFMAHCPPGTLHRLMIMSDREFKAAIAKELQKRMKDEVRKAHQKKKSPIPKKRGK